MRTIWLIGLAGLAWAGPAAAQRTGFTIANRTGKAIETVMVTPTGTGDMQVMRRPDGGGERDVRVPAGATVSMSYDRAGGACDVDVRLIFDDNSEHIEQQLFICGAYLTTSRDGRQVRITSNLGPGE